MLDFCSSSKYSPTCDCNKIATSMQSSVDKSFYKQFTVKLASGGSAIRDARFGIRRERKDAKGQQSLEFVATLTWGSFRHGVLEDIGGMEVQQCFWLLV